MSLSLIGHLLKSAVILFGRLSNKKAIHCRSGWLFQWGESGRYQVIGLKNSYAESGPKNRGINMSDSECDQGSSFETQDM